MKHKREATLSYSEISVLSQEHVETNSKYFTTKNLRSEAALAVIWNSSLSCPSSSNLRSHFLEYTQGMRLMAKSKTRKQSYYPHIQLGAVSIAG